MEEQLMKEIKLSLKSVAVYRPLLENRILQRLNELVYSIDADKTDLSHILQRYSAFYYELTSSNAINSFRDYIIDLIIYNDNPFTRLVETGDISNIDPVLIRNAENDFYFLQLVSQLSSTSIKQYLLKYICKDEVESRTVERLPEWDFSKSAGMDNETLPLSVKAIRDLLISSNDWSQCVDALIKFYSTYGTGMFLKYHAFVWERHGNDGYLRGLDNMDPIRLTDLIGYEEERAEVVSNTQQFLRGFQANNILLYGDRGTGKSSTVKAIVNEYYDQGLRIIEVSKAYLADFPHIVRNLRNRKQKFIIFVDDLVFEDSEENYTTLKAVLEGGVEVRPKNVVIYATSNRRHLIKEKFSDRTGLLSGNTDDEIRAGDTIQEKLSLADRFGITLVFSSPDKNRYLKIVEGIAMKRGIKIDQEELYKEALKWELWYNGRSPRTARQFVDWLEGQMDEHKT